MNRIERGKNMKKWVSENKQELVGGIVVLAVLLSIVLGIAKALGGSSLQETEPLSPIFIVFCVWVAWFLLKLALETVRMVNQTHDKKTDDK